MTMPLLMKRVHPSGTDGRFPSRIMLMVLNKNSSGLSTTKMSVSLFSFFYPSKLSNQFILALLVTLELSSSPKWMKINNKQIGYYRVNYDNEMWVNFAALLKENVDIMTASDRAHILNDVFALADADDEVKYDIAFEIMSYLQKEKHYVPWKVAATQLSALKRALMFTEDFKAFRNFAKNAVENIYKSVGWDVKEGEVLEK